MDGMTLKMPRLIFLAPSLTSLAPSSSLHQRLGAFAAASEKAHRQASLSMVLGGVSAAGKPAREQPCLVHAQSPMSKQASAVQHASRQQCVHRQVQSPDLLISGMPVTGHSLAIASLQLLVVEQDQAAEANLHRLQSGSGYCNMTAARLAAALRRAPDGCC